MSLIRENINSLKKAEKQLEKVAQDAVRDNMDFIMFLLKDDQLGNSVRSDGGLAPYYSDATEDYARADPPRTGVSSKSSSNRWNFQWAGDWLDGMFVKIENDGFDILSRDGKTKMLEEMAGGKLTVLTKENNDKINEEIIKPKLYEHLFYHLLNF